MSGQTPDTVWPPLSLAAAQVKPSSPISLTPLDPPLSAPHVRQRAPLDTKPGCTPDRRPPPCSTLHCSPRITASRFKAKLSLSCKAFWLGPTPYSKIHFPCSCPKGCLPDNEHHPAPLGSAHAFPVFWAFALAFPAAWPALPSHRLPVPTSAAPHPPPPAPEPPAPVTPRVAETVFSSAPHSRLSCLPEVPDTICPDLDSGVRSHLLHQPEGSSTQGGPAPGVPSPEHCLPPAPGTSQRKTVWLVPTGSGPLRFFFSALSSQAQGRTVGLRRSW